MLMNEEIINKLDEITNIIDKDKELNELKELKKEILNDKELLDKIDKLKKLDSYDKNYLNLKNEILNDKKYKRFVELENKLFFDIKDINFHLNSLIEKSGCR